MPTPAAQTPQEEILALLTNLETRLSRIESHLGLSAEEEKQDLSPAVSEEEREEALEIQIGQNWFAKAGIVGLAGGIVFLLTFPYGNISPFIPSLVGYVLVGAIVGLSVAWRETYEQISRYLLGGGLILLYFTTLRLSHFSPEPALTDWMLESVLLTAVVIVNLAVSLRRGSPYLTAISILLGCVTALLTGQTYVALAMLLVLAGVTGWGFFRHRWIAVLLLGMLLIYASFLIMAMNDPAAGNAMRLTGLPQPGSMFLLAVCLTFGVAAAGALREHTETIGVGGAAAVNGGGAFLLLLLVTEIGHYAPAWYMALSVAALALAGLFWRFRRSKYSTFVYAMTGYLAMSVAIVELFPKPDFFIWLCWESLLVVITAVWFRSRFIVVANFMIFLMSFFAYLVTAGTVSLVSASFGVAALLSARILNWQRDRLELHTEMMRNAYLGSALFVIPYALLHSLPGGLVTLSWLGVALCYYIMSRILKSRKYRWMAILTVLMTIVYAFAIILVGFDPLVRIVSLLVLGTALLAISMIYSRRKASRAAREVPGREQEARQG
jgi:hypothetical protein